MRPEKKATKNRETESLQLNDIGFRLVLIPFFGIAIPMFTNMIEVSELSHWQIKLSYGYTILIAFIIWQGNRYLLFSLRSYFDWFNRPIRKIVALILAVTFFTIPISALMLIGWYQLFNGGQIDWNIVLTSTLIIMICVLFITHVYETVFLVRETEGEMIRAEQMERAKAQAELQALKNQIDPHFMFNSLNTISYLIDESPVKAKEFSDSLADVYRYILQSKNRDLVLVQEEVIFLQDYFSLQKIRYGTAVSLEIKIPEAVALVYVMPPISLQILAENAFKHNDFNTLNPLEVMAFYEDEKIIVLNKLRKKIVSGHHSKVGLSNLDERYQLTTERSIEVVETENEFYVALPLLKID
jgi:hypothetical protein